MLYAIADVQYAVRCDAKVLRSDPEYLWVRLGVTDREGMMPPRDQTQFLPTRETPPASSAG
jgi:hypothetical protein